MVNNRAAELQPLYKGLGIDFSATNSVDQESQIVLSCEDADDTKRLELSA